MFPSSLFCIPRSLLRVVAAIGLDPGADAFDLVSYAVAEHVALVTLLCELFLERADLCLERTGCSDIRSKGGEFYTLRSVVRVLVK